MQPLEQRLVTSLDFLAQLQTSAKDELYQIAKNRSVAKNDFIFKTGQHDLNVYILSSGRVKLYCSSIQGRDVLLWFSRAGEIFGLAECLQEKQRQIYARAAEPCEVLCIAHSQFKEFLSTRPEISLLLMRILALRMCEIAQRFLSLANGNIQIGVAQLLLRLSETNGKLAGLDIHMDIPLTEQDIADMVGSSRQGVSTCLAKLKREGVIDIAKHFLVIKKHEFLHHFANGEDLPLSAEQCNSFLGVHGGQTPSGRR